MQNFGDLNWQLFWDEKPPHKPGLRCVKENGWPLMIGQTLDGKFMLWGASLEVLPAAEVADEYVHVIGYFDDIFEAMAVGEGIKPLWKATKKRKKRS
jgi:hypothetical protein